MAECFSQVSAVPRIPGLFLGATYKQTVVGSTGKVEGRGGVGGIFDSYLGKGEQLLV